MQRKYDPRMLFALNAKFPSKQMKYQAFLFFVMVFLGLHLLLFSLSLKIFQTVDVDYVAKSETIGQPRENIKRITEDGIYPLPKRFIALNKWRKGSVIPKQFFRNIPNISTHNFKWILNPHRFCLPLHAGDIIENEIEEIFLLVTIASASWEFERRKIIRKTWASNEQYHEKEVRYLFFVGDGKSSKEKLYLEFIKYGDVVQESFKEAYKNLTLKTQGQLKWATYFCPNARHVMHVDDDVFVNVNDVVEHLLANSNERYPKSCVGWCFIMTQKVVNEIYFTSINTILFHLEDVAFTGIIREKIKNLNLTQLPNGENLCKHMGWPKDKPTNEKLALEWIELRQKV